MIESLALLALFAFGFFALWVACDAIESVEDDWAKHDRSRQL